MALLGRGDRRDFAAHRVPCPDHRGRCAESIGKAGEHAVGEPGKHPVGEPRD